MKKGIVIAGGSFADGKNIKKYINKDTVVVCADAGLLHAESAGIKPDAVIGDFDSMPKPEGGEYELICHKAEKDETDTQLCIDYLLEQNIRKIYIFGALGGARIDHSIANIQLLEYGKDRGAEVVIKDKATDIFLIDSESVSVAGHPGDTLSVFALNKAEGIYYKGLKYPLENGILTSGVPYCVSNSFAEEKAFVSVKKGKLLIIHIGGEKLE